MRRPLLIFLLISAFLLGACQPEPAFPEGLGAEAHIEVKGKPLPHDPKAFTQGLLVKDGVFYESTGMNGESSFRQVEIKTGAVLHETKLASIFFGEGLAYLDGKFYQLTWKNELGFIYDANTFEELGSFSYQGEGWGLASDGANLIRSDGSSRLYWHKPDSFELIKTLEVRQDGKPVLGLNELEYINGEVYANVFLTDTILRIDPETGEVKTVIDASALRPEETKADLNSVLNGIAWDEESKTLYLTGKYWPFVYQARIVDGPKPETTKQP